MATLTKDDSCQNDIKVVPEEPQQPLKVAAKEVESLSPAPKVTAAGHESISMRRDRSLTAFLFEEIAGKKLKCYEKWKLWLALFIAMTVIAITAIVFATVFAVKVNAYESKREAASAETNLLYNMVHDATANYSDHLDERHKIFNTFDDDQDGVWNLEEYYDYFVLDSSAQFVFDNVDANGDDILSWTEIMTSLYTNRLLQSYTSSVYDMYGFTIANSSADEPLFAKYAANVYLQKYNIGEFGYIPREYYYEFEGNSSFKKYDIDHDNVINFTEYSMRAGDEFVSFLRVWDIESYLASFNQTDTLTRAMDTVPRDITNMCPSATDHIRRRLNIDENDIGFDENGYLFFEYSNGGCEAKFWCEGRDDSYQNIEESTEKFYQERVDRIVECMVLAVNAYIHRDLSERECWRKMADCLELKHQNKIRCYCSCSDECENHIYSSGRRLLGSSDCVGNKCACGSGCTCFSGDNQMWIKRENRIQSVLLKDLQIGDYAQTKDSEWSKVWFIKEEESSEYEFLKLYFDEEQYITMTNHHLLYVGERTEQSMKRADQVMIGDTVFVTQNDTLFVEKEIVSIESTISSHGAYAPVTMDGSIVVNNVLSSCYVESPTKAQRLHDTAAMFRWISSYHTNLASFMAHFFYDSLFMKLRTDYGLDAAHIVFNEYSMPCIVVGTLNIAIFVFIRSFSLIF